MREFLRTAWCKDIRTRALKVALVVGTILVAINQGDAILTGALTMEHWVKIILTYCVPYGVSTFSAVQAQRH